MNRAVLSRRPYFPEGGTGMEYTDDDMLDLVEFPDELLETEVGSNWEQTEQALIKMLGLKTRHCA